MAEGVLQREERPGLGVLRRLGSPLGLHELGDVGTERDRQHGTGARVLGVDRV